ncbi:MAG: tyrosine-type recombinase/integrase [Parvibaculum sp.]|nr:tyrosine-type recombinase/integrase [Parvibaculum sp.]
MAKHPWLFRRGDRYYLRARIPIDLVASYQKSEIKRSLGTADRREAEKRVRIESAKVEREFEDRRRALETRNQPIETVPSYILDSIVQEWLSEHLRKMEANDETFMATKEELAEWRTTAEQDVSELQNALVRRDTSLVYSEAKELLVSRKIGPETDRTAFRRFCLLLLRARLFAAQKGLQELQGAHPASLPVPSFNAQGVRVQGAQIGNGAERTLKASVTLGELIKRHAEDPRRKDLSPKTIIGYRIVLKTLEEVFSRDKPIREISKDDCREVFKLLERLPVNASKLYPGMTVREWAALEDAKRISAKTVATHMGNLSALFRFAVDEGLLERNPASKIYSIPKGARGKRKPFSADQLNRIFRHAPFHRPFVQCNSKRDETKAHQFWAPLLALWTGMRANEILQLGTADVRVVSGIAVIRVAFDETRDDMRLKSEGATRIIPIHPELERLGFLKFAQAQQDSKNQLLFPETRLDAHGYRSDDFSKWFARHLKAADAKEARTSFHSFRHNFRDALRNAGVPQERSRRLGGWAGDGSADEGYGDGFSAAELHKEICKIAYPGIDLSHLAT